MQTPPPTDSEHRQGLHYQRLLPLGSGGMAHVHLSLAVGQSGFKRLVVVKSVREELLADPTMRQMFLAEARLSARLNHPNVVQVSEVVETDEGVMLVMEYLDGLAFSAACRAGGDALTLGMRLRVICDVLSGLAYAHDLVDYHGQPLGVVHRDVSAQNVLLTYDGRVKLLDFGIAKVTSAPDRTRTGVIKGRIAYMPLEQVTGKAVDRRTDVYAVGCLLWETVAASRIWGTLSEPQIVRQVLKGGVPALGSRIEVHPELERIVSKATAQLPDDRYATADAMRVDLETFLRTLPPVNLREVGELLSRICSDARADRKRELAGAVAAAERDLATQGIDVEGASQVLRVAANGEDDAQVSGVSQRLGRLERSLSPTPSAHIISAPAPATDPSKSASFAGALRPRRTGVWVALALAGALAGVAWFPSLLRTPAVQGTASAASPRQPVTAATDLIPVVSAHSAALEPDARAEASAVPAPSASVSTKSRHGHARSIAPPAQPAQPTSPQAKPSARAGCNPPYYFAAGIKTYKPECI